MIYLLTMTHKDYTMTYTTKRPKDIPQEVATNEIEEFTLQEFNEEMTLDLPDNIHHLDN